MPVGKTLLSISVFSLSIWGCQGAVRRPAANSPVPGEWSIRLSSESFPDKINYLYLDPGTGRTSFECRKWPPGEQCKLSFNYILDSSGTFLYSIDMMDRDANGPLPAPRIRFFEDGKILSRQLFQRGGDKVTYTERFEYNPAGLVSRVRQYADFADGRLVKTWTFGYGPAGRLDTVSIEHADFRGETGIHYAYDASGRLKKAINNYGYGFELERDAQGRIARLLEYHPHLGSPMGWRVEYRKAKDRFEPDPVKDFFKPDPFSAFP